MHVEDTRDLWGVDLMHPRCFWGTVGTSLMQVDSQGTRSRGSGRSGRSRSKPPGTTFSLISVAVLRLVESRTPSPFITTSGIYPSFEDPSCSTSHQPVDQARGSNQFPFFCIYHSSMCFSPLFEKRRCCDWRHNPISASPRLIGECVYLRNLL